MIHFQSFLSTKASACSFGRWRPKRHWPKLRLLLKTQAKDQRLRPDPRARRSPPGRCQTVLTLHHPVPLRHGDVCCCAKMFLCRRMRTTRRDARTAPLARARVLGQYPSTILHDSRLYFTPCDRGP